MRIFVAVGAVIRDPSNRILLVKHVPQRTSFWEEEWICPGGGLQPGETLKEGARREVKEETNLEIELGEQIPAFDRILEDTHVIYVDFHARKVGGTLQPGDDVGTAKWFVPGEISELGDLHVDTRRLLERAQVL